ncbi:AEC family transporter [Streptomyces sp. NBC_00234]|uniref:AEC family transporter n=1 Tax=Streptomyces sp. NBC_00234 TaxID=2903638 RepID=UPI002E2DE150|nr:AEC family transporter [Streptomyces sp. NBC_00234]
MQALLSAFTPIWALTAVGYAAGRSGLLGEQAEAVLGRFVFHVAMPAALFMMVSQARLGSFVNQSMIAFAAGTVAVCALGFVAAGRFFGRKTADRAVGAMASGYVNSANLGIPVAVQVLGDASFVAQIILFQVLLVSPVILTLLDTGTDRGRVHWRPVLRRMVTMPVRNPIIMASILGVLVSATGLRVPTALGHSFDLLGAAAVPTALITLGLSLHGRRDPAEATEAPGRRAEVAVAVVLKCFVQPLVALGVALLLGLPEHQVLVVVLCSALPTAQNAFLYAREYGLDTALARNSVVASTVVSMGTLSLAAWALGPSGPSGG